MLDPFPQEIQDIIALAKLTFKEATWTKIRIDNGLMNIDESLEMIGELRSQFPNIYIQ